MNVVGLYTKIQSELTSINIDDPKINVLFDKMNRYFKNTYLSYCIYWSDKVFKKTELNNNHLEYHDFVARIKSERKLNNRYSTVIEFKLGNNVILWKFKPSKSMRKLISGSFRIDCVYIDGKHIHMSFNQNSEKSKYIKFDYNDIEVDICSNY